jgi:transposase
MSHELDSSGWAKRAEKPSGLDRAVAAGLPLTAPQRPKPRLKPINRQQLLLRAVEVEQLVPEDHEVRAIWGLVGHLDLSPYYEQIRAVEGVAGREPVDPQLLISLWIYAYSEGVSSAREVSRLCEYHPAYQWLTGMGVINHHTLSDFRVDHQQALDELFAEVLGLLSAEGLITLERMMQDGTKVKACAGADTFRREGRLESHLEMARQQVAAMGDPRSAEEVSPRVRAARQRAAREKQERLQSALRELEKIRASKSGAEAKAEARASQSDPEARVMKQSDGGWAPSYNVQLSTDAASGIIVGVAVSQSGSDYEQLVPAVDRLAEQFGQAPAQVVADGGFTSRPNILALDQRGVDFIGSLGDGAAQSIGQMDRRGVNPAFRPEAFTYEAARNSYTCPGGQTLRYEGKEERPGRTNYQYRAKAADCQACPLKAKCCPQNASKGRMIVRGVDHPVVVAFHEKMQTEAAQQIYQQRGAVAEFPNAWIKQKIGLRQFRLRGLIKVGMEALWACLTYNVGQWIRLRWRVRWAESRA